MDSRQIHWRQCFGCRRFIIYTDDIFDICYIRTLSRKQCIFFSRIRRKECQKIKNGIFVSFTLIFAVTLILNFIAFWQIDGIIKILQVPNELFSMTKTYLYYVFSAYLQLLSLTIFQICSEVWETLLSLLFFYHFLFF